MRRNVLFPNIQFFFAGTLTKLALRFADAVATEAKGQIKANRFIGESMLVLASVLHLGRSGLPSKAITNDDADRIALNLKVRTTFNLVP